MKTPLGISTSRKSILTKMVLATSRISSNQIERAPLSLAALRENLINREAIEAFETSTRDRPFSRWIERARSKVVTHASERPALGPLSPRERLFATYRK